MQTIDAIFQGGKFEPLGPVQLAENERVKLTVEQDRWAEWLAMAKQHRDYLEAKYGVLPDSTPDIRADRDRDG